MIQRIRAWHASLLLLLLPFATLIFTACDEGHPEFGFSMEADYSEVIEAIKNSDKSLSDRVALIEAAVGSGLAESSSMMDMIKEALASMEGTIEEKLAAVEAAMAEQTTALETKLALVEAAVAAGLANSSDQQELLNQAVAALSGSFDEKLAEIESAIQDKSTGLETKLGLVEAAVQEGFADRVKAQAMIAAALKSMGGTLEESLEAVEAALSSQTVELSAKMALIETALTEGFAADSTQNDLIKKAINSLGGTAQEKVKAIENAVKSQSTSLEAKLALIDAALDITGTSQLMNLVKEAVAALQGTEEQKLDAIKNAISGQTTSLETKLGTISAALSQGFIDAKDAIDDVETALQTTLGGLDQSLGTVKDDIITQLTATSAQLTTDELAGALTNIVNAIDSKSQTADQQLAAIQNAVSGLMASLSPDFSLSYVGSTPEITVTTEQTFDIVFKVDPEDMTLVKDSLLIESVSSKVFYRVGITPSAEPEHFVVTSLEADPNTKGQYVATVTAHSSGLIWEEATLSLVYKLGLPGHPKQYTTKPFQATLLPRPADTLEGSYYPNAAFQMRDTFLVLGNKTILDTMGNIFYGMGSTDFKTEKGDETRTYTAAQLNSVSFEPTDPATAASVFTIFDKNKHFVRFYPDTTGNLTWRDFKSKFADDAEHQNVSGKLVLTDNQGAIDYVNLSMNWYVAWTISYEIVDGKQDTLRPSDFDFNGTTYVRNFSQVWTQLQDWGLGYSTIKGAGLHLDYLTMGRGDGYKLAYLRMPDNSPTAYLEVADGVKPVKGDKYQSLGIFRLCVQPSDVDPTYRPTQYLYKFQFSLKVTKDDDTN